MTDQDALFTAPHHDGSELYLDAQAPALGDVAHARVFVPHGPGGSGDDAQVVARRVRDGEPAYTTAEVESTDDAGTWWGVDVPVDGPVTSYRFLLGRGGAHGGFRWLNATGVHARDVSDTADFRLVAHAAPPDWVADQVAYQVFPDRFARSAHTVDAPAWAQPADWDEPVVHRGPGTPRQWYGGDLDGIADKLEHLDQLGATLLYITPVFEGRSNHRYDAITFDRVDPALGGDHALQRLIEAAHARGIRVVGDLTLNHTGVGHEWFERARTDRSSAEAAFYTFGETSDDYVAWLGIKSLPKLDHRSPELRRRLYEGDGSVVARWLRAGLDGWRIDVANMTGRLGDVDLAHDVARAVRRTFEQVGSPGWLLAEHGHDASADLAGDGWHGTMDYNGFTRPVWAWLNGGSDAGPGLPHHLEFLGAPVDLPVLGGPSVVATMREAHAAMPWRSWTASTSHLDSHDTPRFRTVTGGGTDGGIDRAGRGRLRHVLGLALQMTLPGVPS
ncbi:MAG: glycoside hydrolase family 13 protein, partial [Cellulomonadaceae bacterium]|nr:glycoside hydrolase family 13 protein [Cellulomonadaceae bacterium]